MGRSGFGGPSCEVEMCANNCSGHGQCVRSKKRSSGASLQCICDDGYSGFDCSMMPCPNDCSERGICHNGTCFCDNQYKGSDCSVYQDPCPNACSGNGVCDDILGKCVCKEEYVGSACEQWIYGPGGPMEDPCRNECNGNGVCQYEVVDNVTGQTDIIAYDYKNSTQQDPDGKPIGCVCAADTVDPDCKSVADAGCSGNGRNIGGVCACDENFAGVACAWKTPHPTVTTMATAATGFVCARTAMKARIVVS